MTAKNYNKPVLEITAMSREDILSGSDVLIDGSTLFGNDSTDGE